MTSKQPERAGSASAGAASGGVTRSERAAEPVGAYVHARRAGGLLFLSGVGPRRRGSRDIPGVVLSPDGTVASYDIEAQVRACFENVRMILEESGSAWSRIVDVQVFLTDMKRDFATYNRVYAEYFPPGPDQPCRTTVEIGALPTAGNAPINFEVKVIATAGE
ncbi:MAG: RidA family protein [Phycisphaerales bacterium]